MENECKKYLSTGSLNFILSYDLTGGPGPPVSPLWIRAYLFRYFNLFIYRLPMFTHISVNKVLFFFSTRPCHSSLLLPPVLLFSFPSLFPASRYFGAYPLPLLPGGHHSQTLVGILSFGILLMCPYQFSCLYVT